MLRCTSIGGHGVPNQLNENCCIVARTHSSCFWTHLYSVRLLSSQVKNYSYWPLCWRRSWIAVDSFLLFVCGAVLCCLFWEHLLYVGIISISICNSAFSVHAKFLMHFFGPFRVFDSLSLCMGSRQLLHILNKTKHMLYRVFSRVLDPSKQKFFSVWL